MQIKFEFVIYDDVLDTFELDEKTYTFQLNDEQAKSYEFFKETDLHLYNWFRESDVFINWIKEEVYPESIGKKIAICDINDISFRRFYFFKVTSGDSHYEYFKKLFDIYHATDWQDREEVGEEILEHLSGKRQELIIELKEDEVENEESHKDDNSELKEK